MSTNDLFTTGTRLLMLLGACMLMGCDPQELHTDQQADCVILSAEEIGESMVSLYRRAITETAALVKGQPPADVIRKQFESNLALYQQHMLKLGQHVQHLDPTQKRVVENAIRMEHRHLQSDPAAKQLFAEFSSGIHPYHNDPELYATLKSINIITQFAFFDLLQQQVPDATARWGEWMQAHPCSN